MLVYQYPPKIDRTTMQMQEFNASLERKKYKKDSLKTVFLGLLLFAISFFVPFVPVKILLYVFCLFHVFMGILVYNYAKNINSKDNFTKIYDDRIEHSQKSPVTMRVKKFTVFFDDVEKSCQNVVGELCITLKSEHKSVCQVVTKDGVSEINIKNNQISLCFPDPEPKLYIINEFYEKIHYPKKVYREIIDDEEDEY